MKVVKKPKIVAIDLDGTLLSSSYYISKENLNTLMEVSNMGIKIIPATGRRFSSAIRFLEQIPCDSLIILQNGAVIVDKKSREIFFYSIIEKDLFGELYEFNIRNNHYPIYISSPYFGSKLYLRNRLFKYKMLEVYLLKQKEDVEVIGNGNDLKGIEISQIMYFGNVNEMRKLFKDLKTKFGNYLSITITEYKKRNLSILDVMRYGISKGSGLEMIARYFGVKMNRIWAIGDNINDIEMFKVAGFSMAMKNGCDKVKKNASVIIPGNDKNGVSKGLKKFLFGGG